MWWRGREEEEEERTAAAEAVEAREPGVFRLGGGGGIGGVPRPLHTHTHTHKRDRHRTDAPKSHTIKHTYEHDTYTQSYTPGGVCVWVDGEVRWSMVRSSTYQTQ